jgi:hypothetical protein
MEIFAILIKQVEPKISYYRNNILPALCKSYFNLHISFTCFIVAMAMKMETGQFKFNNNWN